MEMLDADAKFSAILKGDAELAAALGGQVRLHAVIAPDGESNGMWLTFQAPSSPYSNGMDGDNLMALPQYTFFVCGRDTGFQALRSAVDRLNKLLTEAPHSAQGSTWVGKMQRLAVTRDVDVEKNLRVFWIGQVYQLAASQL